MSDVDESVTDALSELSADLTDLSTVSDWWRLSSREVLATVDAAYRLVTQAQTVALQLLGEFDSRGLVTGAGASTTEAWLAGARRLRPQEAKRDVALAQLLHRAGRAAAAPTLDSASDEPVEGAAVLSGLVAAEVTVDQAGGDRHRVGRAARGRVSLDTGAGRAGAGR